MVEYGYTLAEYDAVAKKISETVKELTKFVKKDSKLTARDLNDKFGDKWKWQDSLFGSATCV